MKDRLQAVGDTMITGGVDNMEKYKYMLGQAHAYQIVTQEISNLQKEDEKEQNDGNVIDIGTRKYQKLDWHFKKNTKKKNQKHTLKD